MSRGSLAPTALMLLGCNAIFGIEEGYLPEDPETSDQAQTDGADQSTVDAAQPGRVIGESRPGSETSGAPPSTSNSQGSMPQGSTPPEPPPAADATELSAPIQFNDWYVGAGAPLGVIGRAYTARGDNVMLAPAPECNTNTCFQGQPPDGLCVTGHIDAVPAGAGAEYYATNWGANLSLELRNAGDGALWNRASGRALGVAFRVQGARVPPLRFSVSAPPSTEEQFPNYCKLLDARREFSDQILFDSLVHSCWERTTAPLLDRDQGILQISWTIPPTELAYDFDFCVRDIRLIVSSEERAALSISPAPEEAVTPREVRF
jgi:hypothetical protein